MGTQPLLKKGAEASIFGPCLLWQNDRMDQDGTWHGGGPWSRQQCIRRGPSFRERGLAAPPLFGPCLLWSRSPTSATAELLFIFFRALIFEAEERRPGDLCQDAGMWCKFITQITWGPICILWGFVVHSDVDECAMNRGGCDVNASCFNTLGSACCVCMSGYYGNGFSCSGNVVLFYVEQSRSL